MDSPYLQVVFAYVGFLILGLALTLVRRWVRPDGPPSNTWKKFPLYVVFNLLFLAAIWLPHGWRIFPLLLATIGGIAAWEVGRALGRNTPECLVLTASASGLILAADWMTAEDFFRLWLAILFLSTAFTVLAGRRTDLARNLAGAAICCGYLPLCLASFVRFWHADVGGFRAVFLYGVIAINDAFAQVTGQLVGRRPLAPLISPGKTIGGAAGGLLFAAGLGIILSSSAGWSRSQGALLAIGTGLAGLAGDLAASRLKRALGVKDFGTLLGAHGGVLDRFDALIFVAPIFTLLLSGP